MKGCEGAKVRGGDGAAERSRVFLRTFAPSHLRTARRGFTLIELMIVMSLIVVLAGIGLSVHANSQTRAREAVLKENLFRMRDAIDQYYADKNEYPSELGALVTEKYLRAIPEDPFTRSTSTWQTVLSELDPANPSAQPGIYDVKSGSDRVAIDGTQYSDW
jgi:general secretion pathway protein G